MLQGGGHWHRLREGFLDVWERHLLPGEYHLPYFAYKSVGKVLRQTIIAFFVPFRTAVLEGTTGIEWLFERISGGIKARKIFAAGSADLIR